MRYLHLVWAGICLAATPVWAGFTFAQLPSFLCALSIAAALTLRRGGRPAPAGAALSLCWVKLQYLPPLVLFLLVIREWRVLRGLCIGSVALGLCAVVAVGPGGLGQYARALVTADSAPAGLYFTHYPWMK